jgi:transposase-like protein
MNSLAELPSERQCHQQLFKIIWGDTICPECDECRLRFTNKYAWCAKCRKKHFVRLHTPFRHSKLTFQKIWLLIWCWQKKKSINTIRDVVGVSYPTIRRWVRRLRSALPESHTILIGNIAADESFIGKRKYGKQRLIMGAIEKTNQPDTNKRRIRLGIIHDRETETLEAWLLERVAGGSHIDTDLHGGYSELEWIGYSHNAHNHSKGEYGQTNTIEGFWSVLKRSLRKLYNNRLAFSEQDLELVLREWENRHNNPKLFYNVANYLFYADCSGLVQ